MIKKLAHLVMTFACGVACSPEDEKVFKGSGNSEFKPQATMLDALEGVNSLNAEAEPATVAAAVTYNLKVTSNSGAVICRGLAKLEIMSDFKLKFPEAKVNCASLTIDLGGMLASQNKEVIDNDLSHDGQIFSMKRLANATFDPPRPLLLGPVVQNPDKYKSFKKSIESTVIAVEEGTNRPLSGKGRFDIEVFDHNTTYTNNAVGETFENVIHWEMRTSGFNVPAKYGLVFERWEWLWNTRPIMIPKLVIVGKLSDFITGDSAALGDAIAGSLEFSLTVKEYKVK